MPHRYNVSVVIPTLNAAAYLPGLLDVLESQREVELAEIILVDSCSKDKTVDIASTHPLVKVVRVENFSHGRARNLGCAAAQGDIVVFLSQDALPLDDLWLQKLVKPFAEVKVAATYSRQIAREDAYFIERFLLQYIYPDSQKAPVGQEGQDRLTLNKGFFSNVSAAIRRSVLLEYPFDEELIMSEDQQFSRDVLRAGYSVVYVSDSVVIHSHNYTLKNAFQRYFDSAYSLKLIYSGHDLGASVAIGRDYLPLEMRYVLRSHFWRLPYYLCYTAAKVGGTILGRFADRLPRFLARKCSMHKYYWDKKTV